MDRRAALFTVHGEAGHAPSLEEAARQVGVGPGDADAAFGVIPIDPVRGLFAIQVWADRLPAGLEGSADGPFADPEIAPFGPDKAGRSRQE